ncbi:hypothetical protein [Galbibacter sp. BG1]
MKLAGVMILIQMLGGGAEPTVEAKVLSITPIDVCDERAKALNETITPPRHTEDGKIILFERRVCSTVGDFELTKALKELEAQPN